jgi:hypothetical protein
MKQYILLSIFLYLGIPSLTSAGNLNNPVICGLAKTKTVTVIDDSHLPDFIKAITSPPYYRTVKDESPNYSSSNPFEYATYLLSELEPLLASIPSTSSEGRLQLLDEVLNGKTLWGAVSDNEPYKIDPSTELKLQMNTAHLDIEGLVILLQVLTEPKKHPIEKSSPRFYWRSLASKLLARDTAKVLSDLVKNKIIQQKHIPSQWTDWQHPGFGYTLKDSINIGRRRMADRILMCILPQVQLENAENVIKQLD